MVESEKKTDNRRNDNRALRPGNYGTVDFARENNFWVRHYHPTECLIRTGVYNPSIKVRTVRVINRCKNQGDQIP